MSITIGIIGGTGGMGRLFEREFQALGHKVLISSRRTALTPAECAEQSQWVILSVPISETSAIIAQIAPLLNKDQLLMDFTSLKSFPVKAMLEQSISEVIGCHPVFGPSLQSLKNQVIVLCPGRGEKWLPEVKQIFTAMGARLRISTAEAHDKLMAVVQGLVHFTSINFITSLKKLGLDLNEIDAFSSPVYRIRLDFANRILNQDGALYADIEMMNPEVKKVLEVYLKSSDELLTAVNSENRRSFLEIFNSAADYLGDLKQESEKRTDAVIEYLSVLKKE